MQRWGVRSSCAISTSLHHPGLSAVSNVRNAPPIFLFALPKRKTVRARARKKRALTAGNIFRVFPYLPRITTLFLYPGTIVEWTFAPVSARSRFAWRCLGLWTGLGIAVRSTLLSSRAEAQAEVEGSERSKPLREPFSCRVRRRGCQIFRLGLRPRSR